MELTRLQDVTVQARKYYSMQIPVNRNSSFGSNVWAQIKQMRCDMFINEL